MKRGREEREEKVAKLKKSEEERWRARVENWRLARCFEIRVRINLSRT